MGTDPPGNSVGDFREVQDQVFIAPTEQDSQILILNTGAKIAGINLNPKTNPNLFPDIQIARITRGFVLPIINLVRLFPVFNAGGREIANEERLVKEGTIFGERAVALLVVIRVNIKVTFEIVVFARINVDRNPFKDYPKLAQDDRVNDERVVIPDFQIFGSVVLGVIVAAEFKLEILFFVAVVLPDNSLLPLAAFRLDLKIIAGPRGPQLSMVADSTCARSSVRIGFSPDRSARNLAIASC